MITVLGGGFESLEQALRATPAAARRAAVISVNDTTRWLAPHLRREMLAQVALPRDAISAERYGIRGMATPGRLEARISASNRPLGLVRFATTTPARGVRNIKVRIRPGGSERTLPKAFFLPTPGAIGHFALAVRSPNGSLSGSRRARKVPGTNIFVMSSLSPNQLLRTAAPKYGPQVQARFLRSFGPQYSRLLRESR